MSLRAPLLTYRSLCAEFYDNENHPHHDEALLFYMNYARQAHGPILEPMCGTGRFLLPLLDAGYDIEGFDASPAMLDILKKKNNHAVVWSEYVQDFQSTKKYDLIFIPYGSWGLMSAEDSYQSLIRMYDALTQGGRCIIEIETIASVPQTLNMWHRLLQARKDGSCIALNTYPRYDSSSQIFTSLCRYESLVGNRIDKEEVEDFCMYLYRFDEYDAYVKNAGFSHFYKYQNYKKDRATGYDAPLLIYECIK